MLLEPLTVKYLFVPLMVRLSADALPIIAAPVIAKSYSETKVPLNLTVLAESAVSRLVVTLLP